MFSIADIFIYLFIYFKMTHPHYVFNCRHIFPKISHIQHTKRDKTGNMFSLFKPSLDFFDNIKNILRLQ